MGDQLQELLTRFPDLGNDILSEVLQAYGNNVNAAFATLCEMTVEAAHEKDEYLDSRTASRDAGKPQEQSTEVHGISAVTTAADDDRRQASVDENSASHPDDDNLNSESNSECHCRLDSLRHCSEEMRQSNIRGREPSAHSDTTPSSNTGLATETVAGVRACEDDCDVDVFEEAFARMTMAETEALARNLQDFEDVQSAFIGRRGVRYSRPDNPHSVWSSNSSARDKPQLSFASRLCAQRLAEKYRWGDKSEIERLCEATNGNESFTEELLLEQRPELGRVAVIDTSQSTASGVPSAVGIHGHRQLDSHASDNSASLCADCMRSQDTAEMAEFRSIRITSPELRVKELRASLRQNCRNRDRVWSLFRQTQKAQLSQQAKEYEARASEDWRNLVESMCTTAAFRDGVLDLHGFTVDEAIRLVDEMLLRKPSKRLRFITGRGNNSTGHTPVLRPAIVKYLDQLNIPHSIDSSGGAIVARMEVVLKKNRTT